MIKAPAPCIWLDDQAEEAAAFYTSVVPNSRIIGTTLYPKSTEDVSGKPAGTVQTVDIEIGGQFFQLLNGGPTFSPSEGISFILECDTQAEIDELWERMVEQGGEHWPCGWLKDRFGVSWQVVPSGWKELMQSDDPEAYDRAIAAMLKMGKLDIEGLRRAAAGETVAAG
jgi:predicted 3-demethylubiquinone-9 3-methyltransferase (glyoxalase superfamily)